MTGTETGYTNFSREIRGDLIGFGAHSLGRYFQAQLLLTLFLIGYRYVQDGFCLSGRIVNDLSS
jgi:hypothetical protein